MLDAILGGKLHKDPVQRTTQHGKPYTTATAKISQPDGTVIFASLVAFEPEPARKLAALTAGDSLAVQGSVTAKTWQDGKGDVHPSLDVIVTGVLSAYIVKKKRDAMQQATAQPAKATGWERMYQRGGNSGELEDDPV